MLSTATLAISFILMTLTLGSHGQAAPGALPDTEPGRHLKAFLSAVNGKDDALVKSFVSDHFSSLTATRLTPAQRITQLITIRDSHGPFEPIRVLDSAKSRIAAVLRDRDRQSVGIEIVVEAQAPFKIVTIRMGPPESLAPRPPSKRYTSWSDPKDLIGQIRSDCAAPAMAIAIYRPNRPIEQAVVGIRSIDGKEPVRPDDRWHIGSIGKPMTSTLIGLLIDKGKLRWTSTLAELLPDVQMKPGYRPVTIEQLLQHRSGLPQEMSYTAKYVERLTAGKSTAREFRAAYIADLLRKDPIARPGERFAYSNGGYALLGHIAERLMGKPYEQLMHEMVFRPFGMSTAKVGGAGDPGQPQGHVAGERGLVVRNLGGKLGDITAPAGNVSCSIGDLVRFAAVHLDGMCGKASILQPATLKRLHTPPAVPAGQEQYACGWEIESELGASPFQGHGGSNGTFRAHIAIFPKLGLAVASVINMGGETDPSPPLQAIRAVAEREASHKNRKS
jgi:CubicO group peptidase (beta-lactamase class C family)